PSTGTFTPAGKMAFERVSHRATLLGDGRVLITGGQGSDWPEQVMAELYDPSSGTFIPAGKMNSPRADHTATLLGNGKVLIAGGAAGRKQSEKIVSSAEIYDPDSRIFTPTGQMAIMRHKHSAALLPDGRVIVMGGADSRIYRGQFSSAEIYNPDKGIFTLTGNMNTVRYKIRDAVVILKNGKVLVAGAAPRLEVFDPVSSIFSLVSGEMERARYYSTATLLQNGEVLIVGGYVEGMQPD